MSEPNSIDILFKLGSNYSKEEFKQKYLELKEIEQANSDASSIFTSDLEVSIDAIFDTLDSTPDGKLENSEIEKLRQYFTDENNDSVSEGDLDELYKKTIDRLNSQQADVSKPETITNKRVNIQALIDARILASRAKINSLQNELSALVTGNSDASMKLKNKYEKNVANINKQKAEKDKKEAELRSKQEELKHVEAEMNYVKLHKKSDETTQKELDKLADKQAKISKECDSISKDISKIDKKISKLYTANNEILQEINIANENLSAKKDRLNRSIQDEEKNCNDEINSYRFQITNIERTERSAYANTATNYPSDYYDEDTSKFNYDAQALKSKWQASKPNLSDGFYSKVVAISQRIGCDPNALMAVMESESGINSSISNKYTNATGLIQFMPSTARGLGTSIHELKRMSPEEQLNYVEKYLMGAKKSARIGKDEKVDSGTLYALVFMPAKAKQNVFATAGTKAYSLNSGLDKDHDGMITKADLAAKVRSKMK